MDQAKSIALKHAGLSAAEVSFTKAKLEKDDGLRKYEIEFIKGSTEYEYEIDAATGSVLEYDVERSEPAPSNDNRQPDRLLPLLPLLRLGPRLRQKARKNIKCRGCRNARQPLFFFIPVLPRGCTGPS